jgi:tRNA threonylcarbamoyladenosine biosynthesis protein TsaB
MVLNKQPLILSLETATRAGSLALLRGAEVVASSKGDDESSQSNVLLRQLDNLLKKNSCIVRDIELIIAALGPGSFTGLRIGLATVKALAATLGIPCYGVPTLEAVAASAGFSERVIATLPAGRGEVFSQLFAVDAANTVVVLNEATHLPPQTLLEKMKNEKALAWAGIGQQFTEAMLGSYAAGAGIVWRGRETEREAASKDKKDGWRLSAPIENLAQWVGMHGLQKRGSGNDAPVDDGLQAIYVRPSDAELNKNVGNKI